MSPSPDLKRRRSDDGSGASRSFPERAVTRVTPADTPASTFPNVPTVGPSGLIHKRQYVRLLEQSLYELGFADLASALEKRSGVTRATRDAEAFERAVLDGRWDDAVARLPKTAEFAEAQLVCLECLYEDQIRGGAYDAALATLQKRVAPLFDLSPREKKNTPPEPSGFLGDGDRLRGLAVLLMFQADDANNAALTLSGACARECVEAVPGTAVSVAERAASGRLENRLENVSRRRGDAPNTRGRTRNELVLRLALDALPPEWAPPSGRLETLVEQALAAQTRRCEYHNAYAAPPSLFRDYACGEEQLPTRAALTLDAHNDEVWSLAFDHTGARLATASRDGAVILWEVLARGARVRAHETARIDVCEDVCLDGERVIKNRAAWYLSRPERDEDQGEGTARDRRETADVDAAAEPPEPPASSSDSRSRTFDAKDDEEAFEEEFEYEASEFPPDSDFLPLTHVAWSHDASRVVTCGGRFAKVWCARTGALVAMLDHASIDADGDSDGDSDTVVTGAFFFDRIPRDSLEEGFDEVILTTTSDGRKRLVQFESSLVARSPPVFVDPDSDVRRRFKTITEADYGSRIQDAHVVAPRDGAYRRVSGFALANNDVVIEKFASRQLVETTMDHFTTPGKRLHLPSPCMSMRLSSDGESALMNLANGEIALWDRNLEIVEPTTVFVPEVRDRELGKVVTRSCFGGAREQFVACGGVDGRVHVWCRDTGTLLTRLECHATTVNAVCWNPCDPFMMATASDDFTVKLWTAPTADAAR